jgi:hypothetical protein
MEYRRRPRGLDLEGKAIHMVAVCLMDSCKRHYPRMDMPTWQFPGLFGPSGHRQLFGSARGFGHSLSAMMHERCLLVGERMAQSAETLPSKRARPKLSCICTTVHPGTVFPGSYKRAQSWLPALLERAYGFCLPWHEPCNLYMLQTGLLFN